MVVLNPRRAAWEGARTFVSAANSKAYWWLSDAVGHYLGIMYQLKLCETRLRLQLEDEPYAESAAWRVVLDELVDNHPETIPILTQLVSETSDRMARL